MSRLCVEFVGERHVLQSGEQITFGRSADLEIDSNRHLHRVLGRFYDADGLWWLRNEGSVLSLTLADVNSASTSRLAPGSAVPVTYAEAVVLFKAGPTEYELEVRVDGAPLKQHVSEHFLDIDGGDTISARAVRLNEEQRLLLVILGEVRLRSRHAEVEPPTNAQIAGRLDWTSTKLNRKLDNLCAKFDKLGVPGLRGSVDRLAIDRRRRLAEHCIEQQLITPSDLELLDQLN